ncbi:hypothetical protein ANCDUO_16941 [Ancylostoma duodenale]|uniref:Uncharacterized protein n=1 Tax=Ancylostoma duodenale TaxID=51022 RepID=A0A0C2G226_9BILA|nr:hypothetical protein ANCDUO_16941 [Ancylostoma duodenale]
MLLSNSFRDRQQRFYSHEFRIVRYRWLHEDGGVRTRLRRRPVGLRRPVVDVHAAGDAGAKPSAPTSQLRRRSTTLATHQSNAECGLLPGDPY